MIKVKGIGMDNGKINMEKWTVKDTNEGNKEDGKKRSMKR